MIASHYAAPLLRHLAEATPLLASRDEGAETVAHLKAGAKLHMLDCSLGWAWGYTDADHRVGYVRFEALKS